MNTFTDTETKYCRRCGKTKPVKEFGVWGEYMGARAGSPRTYCRECERRNSKASYLKRQQRKSGGDKFLAYVTSPTGQVLDLYLSGSRYLLRESKD